jgi:ubiquinone/menaquinone biosynthesis C-methylase UbiE
MREQTAVNSYFQDAALYWTEIYRREGVLEFIHQERQRIMLGLVDTLGLPCGTRVLEIGCGAGFAAVELAKKGYVVDAIDSVPVMVDLTRMHATQSAVDGTVRSNFGDIHNLDFLDETFGLVVAMGVLPWLRHTEKPLHEMSRVLQHGGYLVLNVNNRWGICSFLDPLTNPVLMPIKRIARRILKCGKSDPRPRTRSMSIRTLDSRLSPLGLQKIRGIVFGFGPFSFFGRELFPYSVGLKIHQALQRLADFGRPIFRSAGVQYMVVAKKY